MNKPNIYLIPGMGLDERLFYQLKLSSKQVHHIHWIEPKRKEAFDDYCMRLVQQIEHRGNLILIGVSFGGFAAIEIAKLVRVQKVIIISSIKTIEERPFSFQIANAIPLYYLTTPAIRQRFRKYTSKRFGLLDEEQLDFFSDMFEKHSAHYKTWAIRQMATWENADYPPNLLHIHGTIDRIFPIKKIDTNDNTVVIENGNHNMIVQQAAKISTLLNEAIEELS